MLMEEWKGNDQVFRTYVEGSEEGDGKSPAKGTRLKGKKKILSYEEASRHWSFGALLQQGIIDISFDTDDLSQMFWEMAESNGWKCLILENPSNGHIHSFWKIPEGWKNRDGKDKKLAVGLVADIHSKDTYIPLRVKGIDRFPPSYEPDSIQILPEELYPVQTTINLLDLKEGQGRNDSLFRCILVLQGEGMDQDTIIRILKNTNDFILSDPLSQDELDTITREEAFEKPIFYQGKTFLHDKFGDFLQRKYNIIRFNRQLHCYRNGIYIAGHRYIENLMFAGNSFH